MGPFYHLVEASDREKCMKEVLRVLKKDGYLITAYIPRFYVFQYVAMQNRNFLDAGLARQLIQTGELRHTEEMEKLYRQYNVTVIDHFAQDGATPHFSEKVDSWDENEFKIWCDYHYSVCRERSLLGASNHVIIAGQKSNSPR